MRVTSGYQAASPLLSLEGSPLAAFGFLIKEPGSSGKARVQRERKDCMPEGRVIFRSLLSQQHLGGHRFWLTDQTYSHHSPGHQGRRVVWDSFS